MLLADPEPTAIVDPAALAASLGLPAAVGPTIARLADAMARADIVCVALDAPRAAAIAAGLAAAVPDALIVHLPAPDALPGEKMASSPANVGARIAALAQLDERRRGRIALILSIEAALSPVPTPAQLGERLTLSQGMALDPAALADCLAELGYIQDDRIDEPGEMACRGTIEIYPTTATCPIRLDLAEGRLTAIRDYDPVSQRSTGMREHAEIMPARWPDQASDDACALARLPRARLALDPGVAERGAQLRAFAEAEAAGRGVIAAKAWDAIVDGRRMVDLAPGDEMRMIRFAEARRPDRAALKSIEEWRAAGDRVVLVGSVRDLRFLTRRLERMKVAAPLSVHAWAEAMATPEGALVSLAMPLDEGWQAVGFKVVAAADILGSRAGDGDSTLVARDPLGLAQDYRIGDVLIHEDHGLAILAGLETVEAAGSSQDAIRLEHAKGAQRLVPVAEADRLWRYGADADAVTLDRLDGKSWAKRRGDIDAQVAVTAKALLAFAAEHADRRTDPIAPPSASYERFVGRFPFTATRDQLRAVDAVRADLLSGKPMDRLIVGDVGYGKTEVALRAAAMVALAGRQVALVAPTTVLARQHLESFTRRFAGLGIKVAGLSRLSSPAEAKAVKAGLADGTISIAIGTQALAADSVVFADLALVIIDEEQRFGAADKTKLRARAAKGHVLTLTATPIPRTLQAALVGLQEISVIATPPARRQPIRTATGPFDPDQVRTALLRERSRGGQSFVVVPRIDDMAPLAEQLARLVPDLVIHQAHGKMPAEAVDQAMVAFANGQGDILLATNIIEAGLDVPRANTMVVMHADRFGLAQLHQLRGRVGRAARRGTILLLTEPGQTIAPATAKRLKTLEALDHLGAGFAISAQDLDQRGAGDLVGEDQAGHVRLIGVDLYQHLLAQALAAARGERAERWSPELHVGGDANWPADWIPEEEIRINLYIRLARLRDEAALDSFAEELEDRFGTLPEPARRLIALARIRHLACTARIARIDAGPAAIALTPRPDFDRKVEGLEVKGARLLLRDPPGSDPLAAVAALLDRVLA